MESAGTKLKNIRLAKGISLEEAGKGTKIHGSVLKAIEEDGTINLSPIYIKGFLKIYCRFLGVDPKDYVPDYAETNQSMPQYAEPAFEDKPEDVPPKVGPSLDIAALRPRIKIKYIALAAGALVAIFLIFEMGKFVVRIASRISVGGKKQAAAATTKKNKPAVVQSKAQIPQQASKQQKVQVPLGKTASSLIKLGITAKADCYIHLKKDGKTVFQSVLKKGRFETWDAKDKFDLTLGNAQAVELQVNGKVISNFGRKGQTIKNIIITQEGLSIPR